MKVSIIIPAHNEEDNIPILLQQIKDSFGNRYEIIVVDDGSTDNTGKTAKRYNVKVIRNEIRHGKGYALRKGFAVARGDIIIDMDADLSHKPSDIPLLIKPFKDRKIGLVIASRALGGSKEYNLIRGFGNFIITKMCNIWVGTKLYDAINGFRAFRKDLTRNLKCNGFEIEIELNARCIENGLKIVEVPSLEMKRGGGKLKSKAIKDGLKFLKQIIIEGTLIKIRKYF